MTTPAKTAASGRLSELSPEDRAGLVGLLRMSKSWGYRVADGEHTSNAPNAAADEIEALAERLTAAEAERDHLHAGLSDIVNCQSPLTRAQVREAAGLVLSEAKLKPFGGGDKSPFVERATATESALAVKEGEDRAPLPALEWAVEKWRSEVEHRPLVNVHRRTLDTTWRQVIRYFGGDPDQLVGPDHDTRLDEERPAR